MDPNALEILVVTFDDLAVDAVDALLARVKEQPQLRVITALVVRGEADGSPAIRDWAEVNDVADLAADLTARAKLGFDAISEHDEVGTGMRPGSGAVVLVVEHVWARMLWRDVVSLGGESLVSVEITDEELRRTEGELGIRAWPDGHC